MLGLKIMGLEARGYILRSRHRADHRIIEVRLALARRG